MKTVNEKKAACGYTQKVIPSVCGNCAHFASDRVLPDWMKHANSRRHVHYTIERDGVEKALRCARHGFAVKKMGACNDWQKAEGGVK
jgi:hypothetical protein